MSRRNIWIGCLLASALLAPASPAAAQSVFIDPAGFDNTGDSGLAPDIGKLQASVAADGDMRLVTVGTWLNRSDLPSGELVAWQIDTGAGGEPTYGGDYLVQVNGRDGTADVWSTWRWADGAWVQYAFPSMQQAMVADGRLYWRTHFSKGASTPEKPVFIGLRALAKHPDGSTTWVDRAPDSTRPNMWVSLEPHGDPDPLAGCTFAGGCVGGASGVSPFGPAPNTPGAGQGGSGSTPPTAGSGPSAACTYARQSLAKVRRQLTRARRAHRRATTRASRRRHARTVSRLNHRRAMWRARVNARC